jgi:di/tricarboxylate transporter
MLGKIPRERRRRYKIIIFIVLPTCFIIGFLLSTKVALLLDYKVDLKGVIIVTFSLIPLYIMSVLVVNRKLREKEIEKKDV